ncbi:MAG: kinase-like domain-containing protein, partial [Olpidium bornovanus]
PGPFDEVYIAIILRELLHGLEYLHSQAKIHRDIKCESHISGFRCRRAAVLSKEQADDVRRYSAARFSIARPKKKNKKRRRTNAEKPSPQFWMAPEVIQQQEYDEKADIWSLGITAIEMAAGTPPLSEIHPMRVLMLIPRSPPPSLDDDGSFSESFKDIVRVCLTKNPKSRPAARCLLGHPFIRSAKPCSVLQGLVDLRRQRRQDLIEVPEGRLTGTV